MARAKKSDILSAFIREKDPDTEKLAELVTKAKGERSVTEFAALCGVNPSTMSRLMNGKNSTASADELIVAIAIHADPRSGVTFQQLVNAHGMFILYEEEYQPEAIAERYQDLFAKIVVEQEIEKKQQDRPWKRGEEAERRVREILCRELMDRGYTVALNKDEVLFNTGAFPMLVDFILKTDALAAEGLEEWAVEVKIGNSHALRDFFSRLFGMAYLESPREAKRRVTLAVCDKITYQLLRDEITGIRIWDSISLMWVDIQQGKVMAEYVIDTRADVEPVRLFTCGEDADYQEIFGIPDENE